MAGPARTGTDPRTSPPGTAAHGARPGTRTRSQAGADAPRPTPRRATPADPPNDPAPPHRPGPDPPGQDDTQLFRSLLEGRQIMAVDTNTVKGQYIATAGVVLAAVVAGIFALLVARSSNHTPSAGPTP